MTQGPETVNEQGEAAEAVAEAAAPTQDAVAAEAALPTTEAEATVEPTDAEVIAQLRAELAATQAKADDYLDKLQRSAAEFQNSRRRLEQQLAEAVERANAGLIRQILPILDDLELAFQNVPESLAAAENGEQAAEVAWLQGFRQIQKKLQDLLANQGLTRVETEGEFDPNRHEAISSEPSETVPSGHIIAEVRAGYVLKGRVLRPALVRVAM